MNPRARRVPVLSTSTVAALVVQVATLVGDLVAPAAPACHPQGVACPHQGWTTDHPARPVPTVLTGVPTVGLMAALTVVPMVDLTAPMAPLVHMGPQVVLTAITVGLMAVHTVDLLALMAPLAWAPTTAPTRDPQEALHHTTCRGLDQEAHPLPQATCSDPCIPAAPAGLVDPHPAMEDPHLEVPHPAWDPLQASTGPHPLEGPLRPWTPGHRHRGQTSSRDPHHMGAPLLTVLLLMAEAPQHLMSTQRSSLHTMHPRQRLLPHPHTMSRPRPLISTVGSRGLTTA